VVEASGADLPGKDVRGAGGLWASGFDGHAQELRECSATLEHAFAHVERADLGPGLLGDFAFPAERLLSGLGVAASAPRSQPCAVTLLGSWGLRPAAWPRRQPEDDD
jgi:hypothetical protein